MQAALQASSLTTDQRPRILSDNGSAYVSGYPKEYLKGESIEHIRSAPFHPLTQGKSSGNDTPSRHRSMKNVLLLEHYYRTDELRQRVAEWVDCYNHQRYHESLDTVTPADMYWGRYEQILAERRKTKSHRRPGTNDSSTPKKLYLSETTKTLKSFSFHPHLSTFT